MDVNELIDNLRMPSWHDLEDPDATLLADAADALSTLRVENEKLRDELKSKVDLVFQQTKELDRRNLLLREQEAEFEQVKNERDSARATLYWIKLHGLKED